MNFFRNFFEFLSIVIIFILIASPTLFFLFSGFLVVFFIYYIFENFQDFELLTIDLVFELLDLFHTDSLMFFVKIICFLIFCFLTVWTITFISYYMVSSLWSLYNIYKNWLKKLFNR